MANTTFTDQVTTVVADWLNDVNDTVYEVLGNGTTVPTTVTELKTNLALENVDNTSDVNKPVSTPTQTALDFKVSKDSNTGAASVPSGTTAERPGVPSNGDIRYNETLDQYEGFSEGSWGALGGGATGFPGNPIFYENDQLVTGDYTVVGTKNAMSAGPITIDTGVTVTIATGATWTIV